MSGERIFNNKNVKIKGCCDFKKGLALNTINN